MRQVKARANDAGKCQYTFYFFHYSLKFQHFKLQKTGWLTAITDMMMTAEDHDLYQAAKSV